MRSQQTFQNSPYVNPQLDQLLAKVERRVATIMRLAEAREGQVSSRPRRTPRR